MKIELRQIDRVRWLIPRQGEMRTDGLIYGDREIVDELREDQALQQVANVATLPGIVGRSLAMPDIHWGYGFPIGGVAAFDEEDGIISPGGVGYDINCGVRLLRSDLPADEARERIETLVEGLFHALPSGVGSSRPDLTLDHDELEELLQQGARWLISRGYGREDDPDRIESGGRLPGADPDRLSSRALDRGLDQVGTLGSGNHFAEVQEVEEIYDPEVAEAFGLRPGTTTVMIHSGSRGLGYQICDDFLERMLDAADRYDIHLPDRQLCCAPISSPEGQDYLAAMAAGANYAFANRQMMAHKAREVFGHLFGDDVVDGMRTVYDVCHNIAKFEDHTLDGEERRVCVHRKGATRAFPAGHPELPDAYRDTGQPVLIPGDMGRYSYVAVGTREGFGATFGSSCHGAGRRMSRRQARRVAKGRSLFRELREQGVHVRSDEARTVAEEISEAYKDVKNVIEVVEAAGIGRSVARLRPLGVIKG